MLLDVRTSNVDACAALECVIARKAPPHVVMVTTYTQLPRVLLIEDDYAIAIRQAEIAWIDGTLTWNPQQLIDEAGKDEEVSAN